MTKNTKIHLRIIEKTDMVKARKYISRNQIQHLVYPLITVFITVHAFVFYR